MSATFAALSLALILSLGISSAAHAQTKRATIRTNGAWVQTTQGSGTDDIKYVLTTMKTSSDGSRVQYGTAWNMGTYNDHGGPANQEVQQATLLNIDLAPGESAVTVIAVFGHSNGTIFPAILEYISSKLQEFAGKSASSNPLVAALAQGGSIAANALSDTMAKADPSEFVGSIEVDTNCDQGGNLAWNYKPLQGATDRGPNPVPGEYRIDLQNTRGSYWFKLAITLQK